MSPTQQHKTIPLAINAEVMGTFKIVVIIMRDLSWDEQRRFRASGQIDCGKRQFLSPLQVPQLPEDVVNRLFSENLCSQDSDLLEYGSAEFGNGDAKQDAHRALQIICQMAPQFYESAIDRTIPCQ